MNKINIDGVLIVEGKDDSILTSLKTFMKRAVIAVVIFFAPAIILGLLEIVGDYSEKISSYDTCMKCLLGDSSCPNVKFINAK